MSFLRPSGLNAVIIMVLSLSWIIPAGASGVFVLKNIEVNSNDESKHVRLEFDGEFTGEPLINFESGSISFRFDSVRTSPTLPSLIDTKSHSFIKAVRAVQVPETDVVHLDILLKSSGYKSEYPVITRSGNNIYLGLNGNLASMPPLSSTEILTKEAEERVNNDQSLSSNFSANSTDDAALSNANDFLPIATEDWTVTMLTLVLSLLFVLLLIYLIAYLYNRFFSGRFPSIQGAIRIKQVSSFHVGPKQKVIIFDMNNRKFACGVTPSTINLIAELEDETDQSFLHAINTDEKNDEIKIDQARANYLKTRESDPQEVNSGAVKKSKEEENHEIAFKDLDQANDIFLKPNSEHENDIEQSNDKNKMHSTPVRPPFEKRSEKFENLSYGSQTVQNFANKLSERLKFLKPIK
ncbi:MAG: flagellar biosynthetic protein FliO [SAR324 cluster bacterium]|nr:flagellar biosynthetic protein FliO [SAR324 cluster bacterium]